MSARHSLTEKDTEKRTGVCSVDGKVKIQRSGTGWACGVKANATSRESKRRKPDFGRGKESEHKLTFSDPVTRAGACPVCGAVEIVAYGRGWACPNTPGAKARVNQQDAPQEHCRDCMAADGVLVWKSVDGCARCAETELNALLAQQAADERVMARLDQDDWGGMHLEGLIDPYYVPEYESAVPGWRTLGGPV